jgi:hypothetical protein
LSAGKHVVVLGALVCALLVAPNCKPAQDECSSEGTESCLGREQAIVCHAHRLVTIACRGPSGCVPAPGPKHCDEAAGVAGEACNSPLRAACSTDKGSILECNGDVWKPVHRCRGVKGCYAENGSVHCDTAGALEGDPCVAEGAGECSVDGRSLLVCKDQRFVNGGTCKDAKSCKEGNGLAGCE